MSQIRIGSRADRDLFPPFPSLRLEHLICSSPRRSSTISSSSTSRKPLLARRDRRLTWRALLSERETRSSRRESGIVLRPSPINTVLSTSLSTSQRPEANRVQVGADKHAFSRLSMLHPSPSHDSGDDRSLLLVRNGDEVDATREASEELTRHLLFQPLRLHGDCRRSRPQLHVKLTSSGQPDGQSIRLLSPRLAQFAQRNGRPSHLGTRIPVGRRHEAIRNPQPSRRDGRSHQPKCLS